MSALDGFLSTWSKAKDTFGEGTPPSGAQFDSSAPLDQMHTTLAAAAPGSHWTGTAASAYDAVNTEHRRVIAELGGLDKRLAAHVDQSAQLVTAGRQDLDAVRKWVVDAAANVPKTAAGERMLIPIANKGIGQVVDIVQKTNGELASIGGKVRGLGSEYAALGDQKFGLKEGTGGEQMGPPDPKRQAEQDVQDALAGNQEAAARVDEVLDSIEPGKELSAEQGSYLSQMQAQQNGMSVDDLKTAEARLGDHKDIIGDSWQLMSNDDVTFPKTDLTVDAVDDPSQTLKGGFDQLPRSVQDSLRNADDLTPIEDSYLLTHHDDLKAISQIVADGDDRFQTGTEVDRELMRAADKVMDVGGIVEPYKANIVQDMFNGVSGDHQIIYDQLSGNHGDDGDDFLHDVNRMDWNDDGKAAGSLFEWTHDAAGGPEADIASGTAEKYATYLGAHEDELMNLPGHMPGQEALGQVNPELVRSYATGLTPYMADIASVSGGAVDQFDALDPANPERTIAKGLFTVLSTDHDAFVTFNGAADALALDNAHQYAEAVKAGVDVHADDPRITNAAVLKGLVDSGSAEAAHEIGLSNDTAREWKTLAYGAGVSALSGPAGPVGGPLLGIFGSAMQDSFIGPAPDTSTPVIPAMTGDESARFVLNALVADGVHVDGIDQYMVDGHIASTEELLRLKMPVPTDNDYQAFLNAQLDDIVGKDSNPTNEYESKYGQVTKIPDPEK